MGKHNAMGHAGREPHPAMKAACEVWMAARTLAAIKPLPGKRIETVLEELTVLQRNLKPNISCHPGHRRATLDSERMPEALGYLFHSDKSSALRNAAFLGQELNRTHSSSMFV